MAQGKLKVKTKLPANVKKSSVHRGVQKKKTKVHNKKSKPTKHIGQKLQLEVTKEINKNIEVEAREMTKKFGESSKIDRKTIQQHQQK